MEKQNAEHLLKLARLHGIAAGFSRVRRRIAMVERGIKFQSNAFT